MAVAAPACAQVRLEARYTASLAGIPLGSGTWVIDVVGDQYTAVASGRTSGLVKLVSNGSGTTGARGVFRGTQSASLGYVSSVIADKRNDEVRMAIVGGVAKEITVDPPVESSPDRVPVTDAHRKGITDPMSASLIAVPGTGELMTPDACRRKLAIFDGRQRADLDLTFKRMDKVKADKGYTGPVVVCTVMFNPIAGHRPERAAIKYLAATHEMEMWLAPIEGTRVLVPFRFSVPTPVGLALLQATYFVASPRLAQSSRETPVAAKVQ